MNWFIDVTGVSFYLEVIGIIAFAVVGVLVGIYYELDFFGIYVEGVISAVGGGVLRDLVLGITPPTSFVYPVYIVIALLAITVALVIFKIRDTKLHKREIHIIKRCINYFDAVGLGVFTAVGCSVACKAGHGDNIFIIIFVGLSTSIGGGIMRDLLAGRKPVIMRKDFYATVAIIGSIIYFFTYKYVNSPDNGDIALYVTSACTLVVRLGAMHMNIGIPYKLKNKALRVDEDLGGKIEE